MAKGFWNRNGFSPDAELPKEGVAGIKLMPEYCVDLPLWGPWEELELSESLLGWLRRWQQDFDSSFHWETGWRSDVARARWSDQARRLEAGLRAEVGSRAEVSANLWPLEEGRHPAT